MEPREPSCTVRPSGSGCVCVHTAVDLDLGMSLPGQTRGHLVEWVGQADSTSLMSCRCPVSKDACSRDLFEAGLNRGVMRRVRRRVIISCLSSTLRTSAGWYGGGIAHQILVSPMGSPAHRYLPAEGRARCSQGPSKGSVDAPAFTSIEGHREHPDVLRPNLLDLVVFRLRFLP